MDDTWSPYIQGSLTCSIEGVDFDLVDPRNEVRLIIVARQDFGKSDILADLTDLFGGSTVADITADWSGLAVSQITSDHYAPYNSFGIRGSTIKYFNVVLRERVINFDTSTMVLNFASDEALLQDYALVANQPAISVTSNLRTIVSNTLRRIGGTLQPGTASATVAIESATWDPGMTGWDYLEPLIQQAGLRLYCDNQRLWHLVTAPHTESGTVALSYIETVKSAEEKVSRDDERFYDAVVIKYEYVDTLGNTIISYDTAESPNFSKVLFLEYATAYPGAGAAQKILAQAPTYALTGDITAISDYSATPGMACTITLPVTGTVNGTIKALTWSFPSDEMTVTTADLAAA